MLSCSIKAIIIAAYKDTVAVNTRGDGSVDIDEVNRFIEFAAEAVREITADSTNLSSKD